MVSINPAGFTVEPPVGLAYWQKLLHFGADRSRVVSREFFLSLTGNTDYIAELNKTIELLNSKAGQEIACNFPARYQWLVKIRQNIPQYKLEDCTGLSEFKSNFQKQTISLVFASEYLDNPVSSFGHTMLLFHDRDKPLLSADTIHFAAQVDTQDGFIKYTWKGLTGGYPGHFFLDPFFKKQYQYNIAEQRYIHLYTLNFSDQQIETLIYHLYELRKASFNYYFINENCTYQIGNLLDIASDDISFSDSGFVLPIEVIKKHKNNYKAYRVLHPTATIVRYLLDDMSQTEKDQFEGIIEGKQLPDNTLTDKIKYALVSYYEYDFRKNRVANPNYNKVMQLSYTPPELDIESPQPLEKQGISRVSAGYLKSRENESMLFAYRPFLLDIFDIQPKDQQAFELLSFNPVIQINNNTTSLHQLDIISIKSLPARSRYFKPVSWHFYTGLNRNNPAENLNYETEFGLGLTNKLSFLSLNYGVNLGIDMTDGDYYYKPNATLLARLGDKLKLGLNASEKYYQENKYIERIAFVSLAVGEYTLNARYTSRTSRNNELIMFSVNRYFE